MDPIRFDRLTTLYAARRTRRQVLGRAIDDGAQVVNQRLTPRPCEMWSHADGGPAR